jgi:hypothetical protein
MPSNPSPLKQLAINPTNRLRLFVPCSNPILDQAAVTQVRNPTAAPPRSNNAPSNSFTSRLTSLFEPQQQHLSNKHSPPQLQTQHKPQKWSTPSSSTSTPKTMPRASPSSSPSCKRRARSTPTTRRLLVGELDVPFCSVKVK